MRTSPPTSLLLAVPALLLCLLLTSCGTTFWKVPYNVGVKHPYVEGKHEIWGGSLVFMEEFELREERLADRTQRCRVDALEIYRIGADYYLKQELVYTPVTKHSYMWDITTPSRRDFPVDDASRQEKATYYFRINERWTQNQSWMSATGLPLLKRQEGLPAGADILTEKQALALKPEFVKVVKDRAKDRKDPRGKYADVVYESARKLRPRYAWTHYAMLPVTAATFVCVDLPCDIVGSIGGGFVFGSMYLLWLCGGEGEGL